MGKKEVRDSFVFLGTDFQSKLIAQLLTDSVFATKMTDLLEIDFFENNWRKMIVKQFLDAWQDENESLLDVSSMMIRIKGTITNPIHLKAIVDYLEKEVPVFCEAKDTAYIQQYAMNFCKQQKLKRTIESIDKIINEGNPDRYPECEQLLKKALELGQGNDDTIDVCSDIDSVLADDFRKPIPTGILGLDSRMDGGLSKGELGVILAAFGAGKTSMITVMANHAKDMGYKVLQIFFEDIPKVIQRKHYTCWYNKTYENQININDVPNHKDEIKKIVKDKRTEGGIIKLKKFPSDGTTIPKIRQYIRKITAQGFKPDIVFLDYIDCVQPAKQFDDQYAGEGNVMRAFETMASELDIVAWTAIQGNRTSLNAEVVESQMMGGSIKRGQIGHFIVSVAKTLEQKEDARATIAILKSRFGIDGVIFRDVVFDNGKLIIEINEEDGKTFLEAKQENVDKNQIAVNEALNKRKAALDRKRSDATLTNDDELQIGTLPIN